MRAWLLFSKSIFASSWFSDQYLKCLHISFRGGWDFACAGELHGFVHGAHLDVKSKILQLIFQTVDTKNCTFWALDPVSMTRWAARAVLSVVKLQILKLWTCLIPSTFWKVFLTMLWLIPDGVASMRTPTVFLKMLMVVARTKILKMKVQIGSMMCQVGLK